MFRRKGESRKAPHSWPISPETLSIPSKNPSISEGIASILPLFEKRSHHRDLDLWTIHEGLKRESTANLDEQRPATLFYLGRVMGIPQLKEVYVEHLDDGRRKHWAVLCERNYEAMDDIYEIEEETLDRFPDEHLSFRTTLWTEGGPSVSDTAYRIYRKRQE